ncbi:MAG: hypothetical protein QOI42_2081 [Frankiaceae bacterium]|nr:hypothetical protein [Frankiaceae bacterium]
MTRAAEPESITVSTGTMSPVVVAMPHDAAALPSAPTAQVSSGTMPEADGS